MSNVHLLSFSANRFSICPPIACLSSRLCQLFGLLRELPDLIYQHPHHHNLYAPTFETNSWSCIVYSLLRANSANVSSGATSWCGETPTWFHPAPPIPPAGKILSTYGCQSIAFRGDFKGAGSCVASHFWLRCSRWKPDEPLPTLVLSPQNP